MKPYLLFFSGGAWVLGLAMLTPVVSAAEESVTRSPAATGSGEEVGVARRDGVTMSGGEAYVTRHRITEKLVKDLELPSGVTVRPDGTVILANGARRALQADQLLTLEGRIVAIPRDPNVNPAPVVPGTAQATGTAATGASTAPTKAASIPTGDRGTFIGSDGIPFLGTITSPGVITKDNGQTVPIDGSIQTTTPGIPNVPMARINLDGTVVTLAGTVVHPDGTVRTKDGTIISPLPLQGAAARQVPIPRLDTVAPEATVTNQLVNPNQATGTAPAGALLPRESIPPNNGGATGGAPLHPGGPAPVGQYGR